MTYLGLALCFVAACVPLFAYAVWRRRPDRRWWGATGLTLLALAVLTAVFDSVMIGADLFRFDESRLAGVFVGLAPIEDFAWPVAAVLVVPAVVLLMTRRPGARRSSDDEGAQP